VHGKRHLIAKGVRALGKKKGPQGGSPPKGGPLFKRRIHWGVFPKEKGGGHKNQFNTRRTGTREHKAKKKTEKKNPGSVEKKRKKGQKGLIHTEYQGGKKKGGELPGGGEAGLWTRTTDTGMRSEKKNRTKGGNVHKGEGEGKGRGGRQSSLKKRGEKNAGKRERQSGKKRETIFFREVPKEPTPRKRKVWSGKKEKSHARGKEKLLEKVTFLKDLKKKGGPKKAV